MQPWTSLLVKAGNTIRQTEDQWLSLVGFQDLTLWVHASQVDVGGAIVTLETAPVPDDAYFQPLAALTVGNPGLYLAVSRGVTATVPLQQFVRWAVSSGSGSDWGITFRILLALNPTVPNFRVARGDETFSNPALGAM